MQNGKLRRFRPDDYYWGGCDGRTVPTCGAIYKRQFMIDYGGYRSEDGYSTDHIFAERNSRKGKIYFCKKVVAVYRYAETNITNSGGVKTQFVLEGAKHRIDMGQYNLKYRVYNKFLREGFIVALSGPWYHDLFPSREVSTREMAKARIFTFLAHIHIYARDYGLE